MFTGIIQAKGQLKQKVSKGIDAKLIIEASDLEWSTVQIGDSIAVNGVCLTVESLLNQGFSADVSEETLSCSTLGMLKLKATVNLEKALTLQTHLGGHLVSGHVDGIGQVVNTKTVGRSLQVSVQVPVGLAKYIAAKGSIAIDGVSLTVNTVQSTVFTVNLVPHTLAMTTLYKIQVGQQVNLEVDMIARYLERLLLSQVEESREPMGTGLSQAFLQSHGFG